MKRITLAAALAAAAASLLACQPAANAPNSGSPSADPNAAARTPTPAPTVSADEIIEKERQMFEAIKQKNWDAFAAVLADDTVYVDPEGAHDRAQAIAKVRKIDMTEYALTDFRVVRVDADAAVVTYTMNAKGSYDGQPVPPLTLRETSAWHRREGRWLNVYHQETQFVEEAPRPSSSPAAAAASPVASPAAAAPAPPPPGADLADLERHVWDLFRRKDWDSFAAMLADDFVEVEPTGVMNKAESVAGVRRTDFTGAALSDFKEVKFDADAGLVTYVVKGPPAFGPQGMRHTTIFSNRGGRWLGVFHQGTMIE